ncbi:MAG: hypothetical protein Q4Q23_04150 [Methanobacteriaceae archaeon]|nr:hypothetical protein [Methanobacteriaceae archaeon]
MVNVKIKRYRIGFVDGECNDFSNRFLYELNICIDKDYFPVITSIKEEYSEYNFIDVLFEIFEYLLDYFNLFVDFEDGNLPVIKLPEIKNGYKCFEILLDSMEYQKLQSYYHLFNEYMEDIYGFLDVSIEDFIQYALGYIISHSIKE